MGANQNSFLLDSLFCMFSVAIEVEWQGFEQDRMNFNLNDLCQVRQIVKNVLKQNSENFQL